MENRKPQERQDYISCCQHCQAQGVVSELLYEDRGKCWRCGINCLFDTAGQPLVDTSKVRLLV